MGFLMRYTVGLESSKEKRNMTLILLQEGMKSELGLLRQADTPMEALVAKFQMLTKF